MRKMRENAEKGDLVPVQVGDRRIYLAVRDMDVEGHGLPGDEQPISGRVPRLDDVLDGIAGFAGKVVDSMQSTKATKVSVEFGCEFAIESGHLVAVVGKASAKSTMTVSLEWAASTA
jgi:Trypsin-co-occurring domain 1